jgi:Family of unknown function (DUF6064)
MSEWWTYTLADFQMFSADTYWRMFELHHRAWWPLHVAGAALVLALFAQWRQPQGRAARWAAWMLAAAWAFLGIAFFASRFAQIHLAGSAIAWGAGIQCVLLVVFAWMAARSRDPRLASTHAMPARSARAGTLLLYAAIAVPLLGVALDRTGSQIEWPGITPDATALLTLAYAAMSMSRWRWCLVPLPMLWLFASTATLWTLGVAERSVPAVGIAIAVIALWPRGASSRAVRGD